MEREREGEREKRRRERKEEKVAGGKKGRGERREGG